MTSYPGVERAKLLIADHGRTLAIVLAVIGVVALASAGWIYANPPTTTVTDQTERQTFESTLHPSAVVTGESALYRSGERLRDQPVYLTDAAPTLTLDLETTVPEGQSVAVNQRIELVTRATHEGDVFWQRSRLLDQRAVTTTNGTVRSSTEIDVPQVESELAPKQNELGSAGSLSVFVRVTTDYETDRYDGTLNRTTRLHLSERTYEIDPLTLQTTESTPVTREVVIPSRDASAYLLPGAVGATALASAAVVGWLWRRREQWDGLADDIHRARYGEWISSGRLPPALGSQYVHVTSLEDLVDVGIDMGKRVIHDPDRDRYAVIDGEVVYWYGDDGWGGGTTDSPGRDDTDSASEDSSTADEMIWLE